MLMIYSDCLHRVEKSVQEQWFDRLICFGWFQICMSSQTNIYNVRMTTTKPSL